jgi:tetratricopeptide (TPR) repeat protein
MGLFGAFSLVLLGAPANAQYREYYLRGKVVDTQKQPIQGMQIQLRDVSTSRSYSMTTGQDGTFKFAGLPHGVYEASFIKKGYPPSQVEWKFENPQDTMQRVDIPDIVLASQAQVDKVGQIKAAESQSKEAAEKIRQRDFDGAIALVKGLLERDPKNSNALFLLGLACVGKQMYPEAIEALRQVTELSPSFPGAHFELGVCYRQLHDLPTALAAFEKSLALDPANADGAYNAGLTLFELNRMEEALVRFEQGLASKPEDPDLLEMAGRCHIHASRIEKAVELLEKARALSTDTAKAAFLGDLVTKLKAQAK